MKILAEYIGKVLIAVQPLSASDVLLKVTKCLITYNISQHEASSKKRCLGNEK
jgi:hypothetical protein